MEKQELDLTRRLVKSLVSLPEQKQEVLVAYSEGMAAMVKAASQPQTARPSP
ncbi:MAG: hypothetical protein IJT94_11060 [Oscillibacter sp.]|nr:hypothetical protein [Oscillibacter sp.]